MERECGSFFLDELPLKVGCRVMIEYFIVLSPYTAAAAAAAVLVGIACPTTMSGSGL